MDTTVQRREVSVGTATAAAVERDEWQPGRNGGRLRTAGTGHGPHKSTTLVKKALEEALRDPRGGSGKEFFVRLKTGTAEDRRVFASITAKLIPIEVAADLGGELLKVVINTYANGDAQLPMQGTCVIGETAARTPIAAPITAKNEVSDAEVIE